LREPCFFVVIIIVGFNGSQEGILEGSRDCMAVEELYGLENLRGGVVAEDSTNYFFGDMVVIIVVVVVAIIIIMIFVMVMFMMMMGDLAECIIGWGEEGDFAICRVEVVD
jgi:hypothetical protein